MKDFHLIVVGKLSDQNISELEREYFKRLTSPKLSIHEVKSQSENLDLEAKAVALKLSEIEKTEKVFVVLLTEKGKQFSSTDFSQWLNSQVERHPVVFIIGGAAGHGKIIIDRADFKLSLSELTYPHKLARLLLVEQIYRAQTIKANHPYNK